MNGVRPDGKLETVQKTTEGCLSTVDQFRLTIFASANFLTSSLNFSRSPSFSFNFRNWIGEGLGSVVLDGGGA